jgi:hypothetical protein
VLFEPRPADRSSGTLADGRGQKLFGASIELAKPAILDSRALMGESRK